METTNRLKISVKTKINAPLEEVWTLWTGPDHITKWNNASEDWFTPSAENDLKVGGKFLYRMEARDGSFGFDFGGTYDEVNENKLIVYTLGDGRKVKITFSSRGNETEIVETFEAEEINSMDIQRDGWQAILNNFRHYAESM